MRNQFYSFYELSRSKLLAVGAISNRFIWQAKIHLGLTSSYQGTKLPSLFKPRQLIARQMAMVYWPHAEWFENIRIPELNQLP